MSTKNSPHSQCLAFYLVINSPIPSHLVFTASVAVSKHQLKFCSVTGNFVRTVVEIARALENIS